MTVVHKRAHTFVRSLSLSLSPSLPPLPPLSLSSLSPSLPPLPPSLSLSSVSLSLSPNISFTHLTHTRPNTHTHTHTHTTHARALACLLMHGRVCNSVVYVCVRALIVHVLARAHTHTRHCCTRARLRTHIRSYIHTHLCTNYTRAHLYIHTRARVQKHTDHSHWLCTQVWIHICTHWGTNA